MKKTLFSITLALLLLMGFCTRGFAIDDDPSQFLKPAYTKVYQKHRTYGHGDGNKMIAYFISITQNSLSVEEMDKFISAMVEYETEKKRIFKALNVKGNSYFAEGVILSLRSSNTPWPIIEKVLAKTLEFKAHKKTDINMVMEELKITEKDTPVAYNLFKYLKDGLMGEELEELHKILNEPVKEAIK